MASFKSYYPWYIGIGTSNIGRGGDREDGPENGPKDEEDDRRMKKTFLRMKEKFLRMKKTFLRMEYRRSLGWSRRFLGWRRRS